MLKVIIADDEEKMRKFIKSSCPKEALRLEICGSASNGLEALELIEKYKPDILITDIRMPDCDGMTLIEKAKEMIPDLEIIIISGYASFECARAAVNYGISSYLLKPVTKQQLYDALEKCASGCRKRENILLERERFLMREGDIVRLRTALLRDLLHRQIGPVNEENLDKIYHFHVRSTDAVQIIMLKICCVGKISRKDLGNLKKKVMQLFRSSLDDICHDLVLEAVRGNIYAAASFPVPCTEQVKNAVSSFLKKTSSKKDILGENHICISLGSVESAGQIVKSFENASSAMLEHLVMPKESILSEIPMASDLPSRSILEKYISDIAHAVDVMSIEASVNAVDLLEERAMAVPNVRGRELMNLVYSAAGVFTASLAWNNIDFILDDFFKKCDRSFSAHQLFDSLRSLQVKLMGKIIEKLQCEESRPVNIAKQHIRENFSDAITLEDVAKSVGFSGSYFSSLFKKETGIGFNQYLIDVRMEKAKELLRNSPDTVTKICRMVGYSDLKHFNRVFKRETGMTPGKYRKIHRHNLEINI